MASVYHALQKESSLQPFLVHTGQQHATMTDGLFEELNIPLPDEYRPYIKQTAEQQTTDIMQWCTAIIDKYNPRMVIVLGDVNTTVAAALAAVKKNIPVAHIESGLRSHDYSMPEEKNRIITDHLSEMLFVPSMDAYDNLQIEGIDSARIHFCGNTGADTLFRIRRSAQKKQYCRKHSLFPGKYIVCTFHRQSNVDSKKALEKLLIAIHYITKILPVCVPIHPRTRHNITHFHLEAYIQPSMVFKPIPPVNYTDFISLILDSAMVITDSGGVQEESTLLGIPCLTIRNNTERPITIYKGTNTIVGTDSKTIIYTIRKILNRKNNIPYIPYGWNGNAASCISSCIKNSV